MSTSNTTAAFVGWSRADPSERWRAVVEGEDEGIVFQQLLDRVRGGDKCILPRGTDPNTTPTLPRCRRF